MTPYIEHGPRILEIEPEDLVVRTYGLDSTVQVWQTDREDTFHHGGAPPRRTNMRIKEVQTKPDGPVFIHRLQCEGLARGADKIEANRIRLPEEGWDEGPIDLLTVKPDQFSQGELESHARTANIVVAIGGDGTVTDTLTAMGNVEVPLAVLPGGSTNVIGQESRPPMSSN